MDSSIIASDCNKAAHNQVESENAMSQADDVAIGLCELRSNGVRDRRTTESSSTLPNIMCAVGDLSKLDDRHLHFNQRQVREVKNEESPLALKVPRLDSESMSVTKLSGRRESAITNYTSPVQPASLILNENNTAAMIPLTKCNEIKRNNANHRKTTMNNDVSKIHSDLILVNAESINNLRHQQYYNLSGVNSSTSAPLDLTDQTSSERTSQLLSNDQCNNNRSLQNTDQNFQSMCNEGNQQNGEASLLTHTGYKSTLSKSIHPPISAAKKHPYVQNVSGADKVYSASHAESTYEMTAVPHAYTKADTIANSKLYSLELPPEDDLRPSNKTEALLSNYMTVNLDNTPNISMIEGRSTNILTPQLNVDEGSIYYMPTQDPIRNCLYTAEQRTVESNDSGYVLIHL